MNKKMGIKRKEKKYQTEIKKYNPEEQKLIEIGRHITIVLPKVYDSHQQKADTFPLNGADSVYNGWIRTDLFDSFGVINLKYDRLNNYKSISDEKIKFASCTGIPIIWIGYPHFKENIKCWLNIGKKIEEIKIDVLLIEYPPLMGPLGGHYTLTGILAKNSPEEDEIYDHLPL